MQLGWAGSRQSTVRALGVAVLCALAAGCLWSQPGFNGRRTGFNPHVHGIDSSNAHTLEAVTTTPEVIAFDMVRSGSGLVHLLGDELRTVDPADGSLVWSMPWSWQNALPTLLAVDDVVYVPSYDPFVAPHGCITPYDAQTGAMADCLRFDLPEPGEVQGQVRIDAVTAGPWIVLTSVFTSASGGAAGWVSAVHTTEPSRSWSAPTSDEPSFHLTNPVIIRSDIVVGVAPTGDASSVLQRWPLECTSAACAPASETVVDVQTANRLAADAEGVRIAVLGPDELLVLSHPTNVTLWSADLGTGNELSSLAWPTWTPESLVAMTSRGVDSGLYRFPADGCGAATCEPTWAGTLTGTPTGQVAAVTDVLVVTTTNEAVRVFPETCTDPCAPLFHPPGYAGYGPAIVDMERVFVVGDFDILSPGQELLSLAPAS